MPATILTTLLLWSSFVLPGPGMDETRDHSSSQVLYRSMVVISQEQATIQGWPVDETSPWTLSEANSEEEESTDGDDNVIVARSCWTLARLGQQGPASSIRLDRGFALAPIRSTVLRC